MITKIVKNIHHNGFAEIRPVLLSLNNPCSPIEEVDSPQYASFIVIP